MKTKKKKKKIKKKFLKKARMLTKINNMKDYLNI